MINNDGVHDTSFNSLILLNKNVYDWKVDFAILLADDDSDTYAREFFRTSINVSKVLQGYRGNFLVAPIVNSMLKALEIDFELKFPFRARKYCINNFTTPGNLFPPMPLKFMVEFKHWARIARSKKTRKMEYSSTFNAYGRLNRKN